MHVIDVLLCKDNDKIRQHGHHRLSVHGIGKELDQQQWRSVLRQLVVLGFLSVDTAGYGAMQLTDTSRPLLRGEVELPLRRDLLVSKKVSNSKVRLTDIATEDNDLWEALRDCRKRLADENNVPPYVIFHDSTLSQIAANRPRDPAALLAISGVGQTKLDRYGSEFLDVVRQS